MLEAVQRAPSRADVVRWLEARECEGEAKAEGKQVERSCKTICKASRTW